MIEVMRKRKREGEFGINTQSKVSWYVRHERQAPAMQRPRSRIRSIKRRFFCNQELLEAGRICVESWPDKPVARSHMFRAAYGWLNCVSQALIKSRKHGSAGKRVSKGLP